MADKMLIDATHPEETRVVVLRGNRVEEFDFESANRKQLRGNIYLAKVTRVEPSLQAAFVDYGGNRHGFLAFSEIHPDYYQIPVADRQALLAAQAEDERDDDDTDAAPPAVEPPDNMPQGELVHVASYIALPVAPADYDMAEAIKVRAAAHCGECHTPRGRGELAFDPACRSEDDTSRTFTTCRHFSPK